MANRGLIVVESPSKIKTIHQIVGNKYVIKATVGHIMEMPKSKLGVDVEDDFKVTLLAQRDKSAVISDLKKAASEASEIFLATDPDREGEAIAEHVSKLFSSGKRVRRIMFNAITPSEINQALANPTTINMPRVYAQQARRAIDRLIGYLLSPEASYYMGEKNFSVGRVQSPAVGLIVEREREIQNFKPQPYWILKANYKIDNQIFTAQYKDGRIEDEKLAEKLHAELQNAKEHRVTEVEKDETSRNPMPPFITSTFQRAAFRAYHYNPKFAMELAQQLYQGVEIKGRQVALITYMRTDSTRISKEGLDMALKQIEKLYGAQYFQRRLYKSRKGAQDAHEAIRPAHPELTPEEVQPYLSEPCFKVYSLIYRRYLASQMKSAVYDRTRAKIFSDSVEMLAEGKTLKFEGFLKAYGYDLSEDETSEEQEDTLPKLEKNDLLTLAETTCERKETQPPPRYNSGSLIEKLEKLNIGRPSTYATIVDKIQERQYVTENRPKRDFTPTPRGIRLYDYLKEKRPLVMNYDYTAELEKDLDQIEEGEKNYVEVMEKLFAPLKEVYADFQGFGSSKPTVKQLDMAKRLAIATKKEIPASALTNAKELSAWIDETKQAGGDDLVLPPSDKQLAFAERLAKEIGMELTKEMRESAPKISKFIDTANKILEHNLMSAMHQIKIECVAEDGKTKECGSLNIVDVIDEKDKKAVGFKTGTTQITWVPRSQIVGLSCDVVTLKSEWAYSKFIEKKPDASRFGAKGAKGRGKTAASKKTAAKETGALAASEKKPAAKKATVKKTAAKKTVKKTAKTKEA